MVNFQNVKQGTGQIFENPDPAEWVGSDGAVTCILVYVNYIDHGVFVAHADCEVQVPGPGDEFDHVRDTVAQRLTAALGDFDAAVHSDIQCFSGGTDQTMYALKAGLEQWCATAPELPPFEGRDSFRVKTDGTGMTLVRFKDVPEEVEGPFDMNVPATIKS